jgi:hypothetical protein
MVIILKIFAIIVFMFFLSQYIKTCKYYNYKKFHNFYLFYSLGLLAFVFGLNRLASAFYITAFYFNLKAFGDDDFYQDFKKWKKGKDISIKDQIMILLSLKIDTDFEWYRLNKKIK